MTTGELAVESVHLTAHLDQSAVLGYALSIERGSEHPIARAVERRATADGGEARPVTQFEVRPGLGATGIVDGHHVAVGNAALLQAEDISIGSLPAPDRPAASIIHVAVNGQPVGAFSLTDSLRPSAIASVEALHRQGLRTVLLTGDAEPVARMVARSLGIDDVRADVLPADKAAVIAQLQADGHRVAMVGPGINDAAALATADLGLALVTGTDIALKSADIVLVREDLRVVPDAIGLARRTRQTIRRNLIWAFAYNLAAVPIAAAGLLNPLIAAAAKSLSSLFVTHNSLRLRDFGGDHDDAERIELSAPVTGGTAD